MCRLYVHLRRPLECDTARWVKEMLHQYDGGKSVNTERIRCISDVCNLYVTHYIWNCCD